MIPSKVLFSTVSPYHCLYFSHNFRNYPMLKLQLKTFLFQFILLRFTLIYLMDYFISPSTCPQRYLTLNTFKSKFESVFLLIFGAHMTADLASPPVYSVFITGSTIHPIRESLLYSFSLTLLVSNSYWFLPLYIFLHSSLYCYCLLSTFVY